MGFLRKSILKPYGRATAMPPAWELSERPEVFVTHILEFVGFPFPSDSVRVKYGKILYLAQSRLLKTWLNEVDTKCFLQVPVQISVRKSLIKKQCFPINKLIFSRSLC